jgi:hypothetical protein
MQKPENMIKAIHSFPLLSKTSLLVLALGIAGVVQSRGATVWDGPLMLFAEATTDATLAANQDRITPNVWITRKASQGIFNAKTETLFTHFSSPADTAWADGTLANYSTLTYVDWNTWAKLQHGGPSGTVGVDAVVHLISEDIYVGIRFTFWGGPAGLFSYQRTTPHVDISPIPLKISLSGNQAVLTWSDAAFSLQSSLTVTGPYITIGGATSPYTNTISGPQNFFRLIK